MSEAVLMVCMGLLGACITSGIAKRRRFPNPRLWAVLGFVFIALAVPLALILPRPKSPVDHNDLSSERTFAAVAVAGFVLTFTFLIPYEESKAAWTCETMIPEVIALSNEGSPGEPSIVGVMRVSEVERSPTLIKCSGIAKWSDVTDTTLEFTATLEEGQWYVTYIPIE